MLAALHFALVMLALAAFALAALEIGGRRGNLLAAGLFFWLLATLAGGAR